MSVSVKNRRLHSMSKFEAHINKKAMREEFQCKMHLPSENVYASMITGELEYGDVKNGKQNLHQAADSKGKITH